MWSLILSIHIVMSDGKVKKFELDNDNYANHTERYLV